MLSNKHLGTSLAKFAVEHFCHKLSLFTREIKLIAQHFYHSIAMFSSNVTYDIHRINGLLF